SQPVTKIVSMSGSAARRPVRKTRPILPMWLAPLACTHLVRTRTKQRLRQVGRRHVFRLGARPSRLARAALAALLICGVLELARARGLGRGLRRVSAGSGICARAVALAGPG